MGQKNNENRPKWVKIYKCLCFSCFWGVWGVWNGLKWSVGPVRSISQSPFLISTILDPFRLHFGCPQAKLLGAFGAWGETFQKNRPWDFWHGLELWKNKSCASKFRAEPRSRNIQSSAMCQKTSISVYGNLRVFLTSCPWRRRRQRKNFGNSSG